MDVVYLVKVDEENDSEELRYSLRSLINLKHDSVYIVGEKPDWVTNIFHIAVEQSQTKHKNWMKNLVAAVNAPEISDNFIMMNDDFFIMKPMDEVPNLHFGDMLQVIRKYEHRYPEGTNYIEKMKKCYQLLLSLGYDAPISYELHTPMVLNKHKVKQMLEEAKGESRGQFRTFYGNYFGVGGVESEDVKIFLDSKHNHPDCSSNPLAYMQKQELLSATGGSFKKGPLGDFIRKSFPTKSKYEL